MDIKIRYWFGLPLLLFFSCMAAAAQAQQPTLEWVQRFDGKSMMTGITDERPVSLAVDAAGNSYVTGTSEGEDTQRMTTVKYSPSGEQLWAVQLEDYFSLATDIAIDNAGGVYVTGYSEDGNGNGYVTLRCDATTGNQTWVQRYQGGSYDDAIALAVDDQGGVYVTGDDTTIRYDAATGEQTWVEHYDGAATDIATDGQGGVYVTGSSSGDYVTVRYNAATGEQTWIKRYHEPGSSEGYAIAIAVDNHGGVYVTGDSYGTSFDYATVRYDATTGNQIWAQHYDGGSIDHVEAVAVDSQGGVYVTGTSFGGGDPEYATIRYAAATGEQTWLQRYRGGSDNFGRALAVDSQGGVYVTGTSRSRNEAGIDYATIRYDAVTGEQAWAQHYGGESHDFAIAIAVDKQGGVYVTGSSSGDYATVRYAAATGEQVWAQRYDRTADSNDSPVAVAVDAAGNSYVTGTSEGAESTMRMATVKYSPSGEQLWAVQFGDFSAAAAIAVDNAGGVYVTGSNYGPLMGSLEATNFITVRYDAATGEETWSRNYSEEASHAEAKAIAVDNTGGVYVTGDSYPTRDPSSEDTGFDYATVRYDAATGEDTWVRRYHGGEGDDFAQAIAVDNTGGVYVTGDSYGKDSPDFATVRYEAATGEESWVQRYDQGPGEVPTAIAVDNQGSVYVTGTSSERGEEGLISDFATVRYDAATGKRIWSRSLFLGKGIESQANAIAVDNTGGVYITGDSFGSEDIVYDYATVRYDAATGEESWVQRYDGAGGDDRARAVAIDNRGGIYVTGYSYTGGEDAGTSVYATVRYDAATGEQVWVEHYDEPNSSEEVAMDMALDNMGGVIVIGYVRDREEWHDFLTLKYSQQGQCAELADAAIAGAPAVPAGAEGSAYTLSLPSTSVFDWSITGSDGNALTTFTGQGSSSITVSWPDAPDAYKVRVTYGGTEGCSTKTADLYAHVFDPTAGFVTGGGWSDSPASSAYELMQEGGRAYWGFAAKYRKGDQDQVQGETLLLLEAGSLAFRSTGVEDGTLVITGNRAYYRGHGSLAYLDASRGVVTDPRRFGYLVAATDGRLGESAGPDMLRIKIWEVNDDGGEGAVVYDSQASCPEGNVDENAPACDAIAKGSIVIHRPSIKNLKASSSLAFDEASGLKVYPTAVTDRATVNFFMEAGGEYALEFYDMKGALVRQMASGTAEAGRRYEQSFSAEGVGNGFYLVRLTTKAGVQSVKVVVQR